MMMESTLLDKAPALQTLIAAAAPDYPRAVQLQICHQLLLAMRNNDWSLANYFIATYQNEGTLSRGFSGKFQHLMGGMARAAS